MSELAVGILGSGFIADYHARAIAATAGCELTAVASRASANAESFAREHGIRTVHTSYSALLADQNIGAVVIATPNALHASQSLAAFGHGKHVLVEKPMAMSYGEATEMVTAAATAKCTLMVGLMWRFDVQVRYLEHAIRAGELGRPFETLGYAVHEAWAPSGWFTQSELAGGGALVDMGIHAIDTARFVLGNPSPRSVYARIATRFGDYDVDDSATLVVAWENDAHSVIQAGWSYPRAEAPEAATRVYGTTGYGSLFPTFTKSRETPLEQVKLPEFPFRREHCDQSIYDAQMAAFTEACRTGVVARGATAEDGAVMTAILDAAYQSARTGEVVTPDLSGRLRVT